ncbi:MAG TPA: flavin reductase family protein [Dehalococcoidia bacterium]|jgi:flavin reductase (DIM6/NTAB) family NADH-FMN oxidoreductase RutF|nr:flavin reductase family protein [Dehalococcoidia bacterium]
MTPSKDEFRRAMGRFATGVTVITTRLGDDLHGMTANAVTSLSLAPMMVLVCVDKTADTHDILSQAGVFAVNILNKDQAEISDRFAKKEFDGAHGLDDLPHGFALTGSPILEGAIAYLDCRTAMEHHGGDHTIFIGEVVEAKELSDDEPLLFYRGKYGVFRSPPS